MLLVLTYLQFFLALVFLYQSYLVLCFLIKDYKLKLKVQIEKEYHHLDGSKSIPLNSKSFLDQNFYFKIVNLP